MDTVLIYIKKTLYIGPLHIGLPTYRAPICRTPIYAAATYRVPISRDPIYRHYILGLYIKPLYRGDSMDPGYDGRCMYASGLVLFELDSLVPLGWTERPPRVPLKRISRTR